VDVRAVAADEHAVLGALTRLAYETLDGAVHEPDYYAELEDVASRAAVAEVLVAIDDEGGIVGGVTFVADVDNPYAEFDDPEAAGMRMLAVAVNEQGRGAGEALVLACIDRARVAGRRRLRLHTTPWMPAAHRLYERLGFRRAPDHDWLPVPEIPLLAYVLDL
jgi:GNAT superfamily N-acetyltransferase